MFYQSGFKDLQLASMKRALTQSQGSSKKRRTKKTTRKRRRKKESIFLNIYSILLLHLNQYVTLQYNTYFRWRRQTRYEELKKKKEQENGEENEKLSFPT